MPERAGVHFDARNFTGGMANKRRLISAERFELGNGKKAAIREHNIQGLNGMAFALDIAIAMGIAKCIELLKEYGVDVRVFFEQPHRCVFQAFVNPLAAYCNVPAPHRSLMAYVDQMDGRLSDRTKREYTPRLKEIGKNIRHIGDTLTPEMLVEHVRDLVVSGQIASSPYRSYKSAITFWIGQQTRSVIAGGGNPSNYARAYDSLQSFKYSQTAPASRLASAKKLKFFDSECLDALIKYSKEKGTRAPSAAKAAAFAKANLLVGLRPSEWFSARLASRYNVLPSASATLI